MLQTNISSPDISAIWAPLDVAIRKWAIEQFIDITDLELDGMEYLLTRAETLTQFVLKGIAAAAEDVQQTDELRKHAGALYKYDYEER